MNKTAEIMTREEALKLPLKDRPLCFRISSEVYTAIFESIGAASMCWTPAPFTEAFDSDKASGIAVKLCFVVAADIEKANTWRPIETAPRDGTYILLAGPSGYIGTPLRVEVCKYDAEYRPLQPWVTFSNDSFMDGGEAPTHWLPMPDNLPPA